MSKSEIQYSLEKFEDAIQRLQEAVRDASDGNELKQDGAIQRFEFTFELMWKTLKRYLDFLGKEAPTPRDTLKEAFRIGFLSDEKLFLAMLEDRNTCSHVYDFETTRRIFNEVEKKYLSAMIQVYEYLKKKLSQI